MAEEGISIGFIRARRVAGTAFSRGKLTFALAAAYTAINLSGTIS
jgi:hypothetical protein